MYFLEIPLHFIFFIIIIILHLVFSNFFSFISFFMMFILIYFYGSICSIIIWIFYFVLNVASALWIPQSWNEMSYPGVRFFFWSKHLHKMMRVFFNFFPSSPNTSLLRILISIAFEFEMIPTASAKQLNRKKKTYKISITRSEIKRKKKQKNLKKHKKKNNKQIRKKDFNKRKRKRRSRMKNR